MDRLRCGPCLAWLCCFVAIILVIVLNIAGTAIFRGPRPAFDSVLLGDIAIFSLVVPYAQYTPAAPGYAAFRWNMYLNTACMNQVYFIREQLSPNCLKPSPGYVFDLPDLLQATDESIRSNWVNTTRDPTPSQTSQNVQVEAIHTIVPFIFYVFGLIDLGIFILTGPLTFLGMRHINLFSFSVTGGAFLALLSASAILTSTASAASSQLSTLPQNTPYISSPHLPSRFLGVTWSATILAFLATTLTFLEWEMERFTPAGYRIHRSHKPVDASWFWPFTR